MNDIDKMPVKCLDCPYWELATFPWCCGDCKDIMNPKNGEYIKRIDAKRALTALPADLDAETVQRCIEAMNNPKAADVEPRQKWIPVTERLPEVGEDVLIYAVGKSDDFSSVIVITDRIIFRLFPSGEGVETWNSPWQYFMTNYEITHWMPLPEPPKEEKE